jgi:hypothetical protein
MLKNGDPPTGRPGPLESIPAFPDHVDRAANVPGFTFIDLRNERPCKVQPNWR